MNSGKRRIDLTVNGKRITREVEPRLLLSDFLRGELRLTGTHVGCAHGVCGACTVAINGSTARSCLTFAVQMDGAVIETVESLAAPRGPLSVIQQAFHEHHALQCGFCTPGFLMNTRELLAHDPDPSEQTIRAALSGNICRCTGYVNIVRAVRAAARKLADQATDGR
jgi:carbon-monoxide dehydrogenase small subunit